VLGGAKAKFFLFSEVAPIISNLRKVMISAMPYHSERVLKASKSGQGLFSDEIKAKFGTIFTPDFVVDKCLDLVWKYNTKDKLTLTYCDPCVGDGNFLVALYQRLMKEPSELPVNLKSKHIIENCLFGIDIIDNMVDTTKMVLFEQHCRSCGDNYISIEFNNFVWGNTIVVPKDTEQEWYSKRAEFEGGLLPEEIRNKKYDVIVTNCPYTHLRNLDNRRYNAYPNQRDMAQVFVRWSLDHINEDGIISYNISDTWLVKLCDGAIETRKCCFGKIKEIISKNIEYSYGDGGNISKFIIVLTNKIENIINFDGENVSLNEEDNYLIKLTEKNKFEFNSIKIIEFTNENIRGIRCKNESSIYKNKVFFDDDDGDDYYIIGKCVIGNAGSENKFKIVKTNDIKNYINKNFDSEITYFKCQNREIAVFLVGCLNTKIMMQQYKKIFKKGGGDWKNKNYWVAFLAANTWCNLYIPDFDYYKTNKSEQFNIYMKWIEENMGNKDIFLAGIDEQFIKLIN